MNIGYARVSTEEQNLNLQVIALNNAGCAKIFTDHGISGRDFDRPGLIAAIDAVSSGGKLVVWRLDRLGRSLPKLIELIDHLGRKNVEFHSLTENIDTSSSGGRLIFHIMGALAEFERTLISERTRAGMEAARLRGTRFGRRSLLTPTQICQAVTAVTSGVTPARVAKQYGVTPRTIKRYVKQRCAG